MFPTVEWTGSLSVAWVTCGSNCLRDTGLRGWAGLLERWGDFWLSDFLTWLFFLGSSGGVINSGRVWKREVGRQSLSLALIHSLTPVLNGIHRFPSSDQQLLSRSSWCPFNKPLTAPTSPHLRGSGSVGLCPDSSPLSLLFFHWTLTSLEL